MEKIIDKIKRMGSMWIIVLTAALIVATGVQAQQGEDTTMGENMMGGGMMGQGMMGRGMMGYGMMQRMRMGGCPTMGLMGTLHQWGSYFFSHKDQLELSEAQLDKIEPILNGHIKYAIEKNADRKVMLIDIQEMLVKDKIDLRAVEKKLKAVEALTTDMSMEGIQTLEKALAVLTPEQQKNIKTLFKEATFTRTMRMGPGKGQMMGPDRGSMMKRKMR